MVVDVPDRQRIFVLSAAASEADLLRVRRDLGRDPVVLVAPTAEGRRAVETLQVQPVVEMLLAPLTFPPADRGHRVDELVRRHALHDRFRDVVVVSDAATTTLLLRALAPDQLAAGGAVTVVGLPRGERPIDVRRAVVAGLVIGVLGGLVAPFSPVLVLFAVLASVGVVLQVARPVRHVGRELLLASVIAVGSLLFVVTGSARFPGGW